MSTALATTPSTGITTKRRIAGISEPTSLYERSAESIARADVATEGEPPLTRHFVSRTGSSSRSPPWARRPARERSGTPSPAGRASLRRQEYARRGFAHRLTGSWRRLDGGVPYYQYQFLCVGVGLGLFGVGQMVAVGVGVGTWVGVGHDVALPLGELLAVGTGVEVPYQPAENQYLFVGDGVGLWVGDGQTGGGVTRVGVGHGVGLAVGESLAVGVGVGTRTSLLYIDFDRFR